MFKGEGGQIHEGHRQRMREKFLMHGPRIFDTYELLEMLLYYVIPYKDTNPTAKKLLSAFGSLDGVLRASEEELKSVEGIGEKAARFLSLVGKTTEEECFFAPLYAQRVFDNYDDAGRFLTEYYEENRDTSISVMLLDDSMRFLGIEKIDGENFGSAAIKAKAFITPAIKYSATMAIISHCHRYGPDFPTESERVTSRLVRDGLLQIGVNLVEHYVISGRNYCGISSRYAYKLNSDSPELERFIASRGESSTKND